MEQMSVKDLYILCVREMKQGNAEKKIVISDDNEGNGFHGLFYGFADANDYKDLIYDSAEKDENNLVVLG